MLLHCIIPLKLCCMKLINLSNDSTFMACLTICANIPSRPASCSCILKTNLQVRRWMTFLYQCTHQDQATSAPQEAVSLNFSSYLEKVGLSNITCNVVDSSAGQQSEMRVTLADVLHFITGSSSISAIGFDDQPSITFLHDNSGRKLSANTCFNIVQHSGAKLRYCTLNKG